MPTGHRLTARQIGLIRRLYEEARWLAVEDIAGIAGITRATVLNHARRGGWRRRGHTGIQFQPRLHEAPALAATAAEPAAMADEGGPALDRSPPVPPDESVADVAAAACPDRGPDRGALIAGLWRAVQLHVAELSGPAGGGGAAGGGTGEPGSGRAAETLMTIARTVEKLMEMERADAAADRDPAGAGGGADAASGRGGAGPAGRGGGGRDADAFRDELAARLEALLLERLARDDLSDDIDDSPAGPAGNAPGDVPAGDLPGAAFGDH